MNYALYDFVAVTHSSALDRRSGALRSPRQVGETDSAEKRRERIEPIGGVKTTMTIEMTRRTAIASAILAAVVGAAPSRAADEPIRIGSFLSLTGPASFLGDPELKTLRLFVDRINEAGGVLGRKLTFVHYDDGSEAAKANGFVKRLIESDGVDVIIGGTTTGTTMAAVPLIEKVGIPFISLAGGIVVVEPVKKWVFKTPGSDTFSIARILDDMKKRGITKLALLSESSGIGQSSRAEAQKLVEKYGITLVADETFGSKDIDVTAQLTRIRANGAAQAVAIFGFGQGPAVATKNYAQLGLTLPLYHTHGVASQEFIQLVGAAGEKVRLSSPALIVADDLPDDDPQKPVLVAYRDVYEKAYGERPATFGGYAYDALTIMIQAITRAGGVDKAKVRDALETTHGHAGTAGTFDMSPSDHMGLDLGSFRLVEIRDGRFRLVP